MIRKKADNKELSLYWKDEIAQIENPYFSTIAFEEFLKKNGCFRSGTEVMDIGSGFGSVLHYFGRKNPEVAFLGLDYNPDKEDLGKKILEKKPLDNVVLGTGDWLNLNDSYKQRFEGIINVHALCCFKEMEMAIKPLADLQPAWLAFNSLFYDGPLDVLIHIRDHDCPELTDDDPDGDFNIFSLWKAKDIFGKYGYELIDDQEFYPQERLERKRAGRGSYTIKTEIHERTQFSGPVYLPWRFVLFAKKDKGID